MSSAENLESSSKRNNVDSQKKEHRSVCRLSEAETWREKGSHSNNIFRQIGSNRDSIPRYECSKVSAPNSPSVSATPEHRLYVTHMLNVDRQLLLLARTLVNVLLTVLEPPLHITVIHNTLKQVAHRISGPVLTPSFSPRKN